MEYRTRATFLGLPLIHVATGSLVDGRYRRGVARGWIAVGDLSCGVLVSLGGVAVGGVAVGGVSLGVVSIAGLALGVCAIGGGAIGIVACGGGALGLVAALGGLAVARDYALGGMAIAEHANDPAARELFEGAAFSWMTWLMAHSRWLLLLVLLPALPGLFRWLRPQGPDRST